MELLTLHPFSGHSQAGGRGEGRPWGLLSLSQTPTKSLPPLLSVAFYLHPQPSLPSDHGCISPMKDEFLSQTFAYCLHTLTCRVWDPNSNYARENTRTTFAVKEGFQESTPDLICNECCERHVTCVRLGCPCSSPTPPPYPTTPGPGNWSSFDVSLKSCLMGRKSFSLHGERRRGRIGHGAHLFHKEEAMKDSWEPKSRSVESKLWMFGNSTQKFLILLVKPDSDFQNNGPQHSLGNKILITPAYSLPILEGHTFLLAK